MHFYFAECHGQTIASSIKTLSKDPRNQSYACIVSVAGSSTPITSKHCSDTSPLSNKGTKKPPFGCGCGKCTFFSFIEWGCPKPISSTSSFPYLDLSGLTDKQKEDLRESLQYESRQIMMQFQKLVSAIIESLIEQNVSLQRLVSHVMTLGAFDPIFKKPQMPLLHDRRKELKTADSVPNIFLVLQDYFSFFNYDIIEHIIEVLGTKEDNAKLQHYKEKFNQYAKRRIFECGPCFGCESEAENSDIFVKLDSGYDNYTAGEIKGFCRRLSEILHVSSKGVLHLCRVDEGCIQLTFQAPSFVQQEIFPLSIEQERTLKAEGVIKLTCGEYQFPNSEKPQLCIGTSGELLVTTFFKTHVLNGGHHTAADEAW